ncbi:methylenetetrahydrofolate--tRNA-(uracil-5-)-methyltransferase [Desulfonatronum thiosulfatophilum]|uniref:Methylenetetrahydrofolate--tRNA-(uracil-5-)-methyltransferase TrmFO n=1 Tax=Desulfonatronum thiosulfatophilum TaxID=617002 RepID=A0A1G6EHF6_9BACT|nr:methylenetetrahydrofolate--tRNA-(uracil(54)-C(5))-methyltransferase (FADH(2)-oxidizing) TrmFO [Desulfonatronum thiosulfatophilum]SDB56405.1 methylenetetrahydrofolate--tRNA-(uracil-5-)-methyltransferase [Desulfonatronum thiosulfatophilum]
MNLTPISDDPRTVAVVGAGLAGCECAWQLARGGISVRLYEMKPDRFSPAHSSPNLAELVCSNSLRSDEPEAAVGLLKQEMTELDSLVMAAARATRVPAGKALAVDRELFAEWITKRIHDEPRITLVREEVRSLDDPRLAGADLVVIAAGPLAGEELAEDLRTAVGGDHLYFYDAIAPIVAAESVDMSIAFWGSRYNPDEHDYLNCPLDEETYRRFHAELLGARKVAAREFEKTIHFEACLPIETLAERGEMTMAFGPLKPVGLVDPQTGAQPFAVVQLRAENLDKTAFNLVGFQTKLAYPEQERIFRLIPGLAQAEFLRLGSMHRNTYVNAPQALTPDLELRARPGVFLAGQITGVEGYVESAACGLWLGHALTARLQGRNIPQPPPETALGALLRHLQTQTKNFQPSNVNFGLMPELKARGKKAQRKAMQAQRARETWLKWMESNCES